MSKDIKIDFGKYAIRTQSGMVDFSATVNKFRDELTTWDEGQEDRLHAIKKGVNALFDEHLGQRLPMTYLAPQVADRLGATPANHQSVQKEVLDYIRANLDDKGECLFSSTKGPGGGVARVCDQ